MKLKLDKRFLSIAIFLLCVYLTFIILNERMTLARAQDELYRVAELIKVSVWNLDAKSSYVMLEAFLEARKFESINVYDNKGRLFVSAETKAIKNSVDVFMKQIGMIREIRINTNIAFEGTRLGYITAIWLNKNVYTYIYAISMVILLDLIAFYYLSLIDRDRKLADVNKSLHDEISLKELAEKALRESNETLEANVSERTRELTTANEELEFLYAEMEELYSNQELLTIKIESVIQLSAQLTEFADKNDEQFLSNILEIAMQLIPEADCGSVSLIEGDDWRFVAAVGHNLEKLKSIPLKKEYILNSSNSSIRFENLEEYNANIMPPEIFSIMSDAVKKIKSALIVELKVGKEHVGNLALDISEGNLNDFPSNAEEVLKAFGGQASAFLTIRRFQEIKNKIQKQVILSMINILEIYDSYTKGHSENVANVSVAIAEEMGLSPDIVSTIYWSGMIHDIGKLLVPKEILNKSSKLSLEEFNLVKRHPEWGYMALKDSDGLSEAANAILHHHERWDGRGYPDGLIGEEIPLISRIICVADAYDAMISDRSYRSGISADAAICEIEKESGRQFDPEIADIFMKISPYLFSSCSLHVYN